MTRLARETGRGHPRTAHPRPEAEGVPERRSLPMRFAWRVVEHGGVRNHRVCAGVSDPLAGELQHATRHRYQPAVNTGTSTAIAMRFHAFS